MSTPLLDLIDITSRKSRNNPESAAAFEKVVNSKNEWYRKIKLFVSAQGNATSKEICRHFHKLPHELSGRIAEMRHFRNELRQVGKERRDGSAVLELTGR